MADDEGGNTSPRVRITRTQGPEGAVTVIEGNLTASQIGAAVSPAPAPAQAQAQAQAPAPVQPPIGNYLIQHPGASALGSFGTRLIKIGPGERCPDYTQVKDKYNVQLEHVVVCNNGQCGVGKTRSFHQWLKHQDATGGRKLKVLSFSARQVQAQGLAADSKELGFRCYLGSDIRQLRT